TLERIYHKGQERSWDGQAVLRALVERHGQPRVAPALRPALARLFAVIMWGELAAWKVSAALAEELEPFPAKLAATSQAHDEARHFFVMHDYLELLGAMPDRLDRPIERLLSAVMNADHLAKKLIGMQLMVEPVALSVFHVVRALDVEPVLTGLMPYYQRDEARHVALGLKYLPAMIRQMSTRERVALMRFQFRLLTLELWGSVGLMRDYKALGIDLRVAVEVARAKQRKALELLIAEMGIRSTLPIELLDRYSSAMTEALLPADDVTLRERLRGFARTAAWGKQPIDEALADEITTPAA
ncbi:MAG: ferritin-like domain-containing protein, partial [Myxococcales bacterium]|nr:ferritin-like domain-containing protein [Myxococcales bacterium]